MKWLQADCRGPGGPYRLAVGELGLFLMTLPGTSKGVFERQLLETLALPCEAPAGAPAGQAASQGEEPEALLERCLRLVEHWGPESANQVHASPLPLDLRGSTFHRKVWRTLLLVPPGKTISYGRLAALAGSPGAARAVGTAMRMNRIPILVPCHRVVASNGPGGYGGGLPLKQQLLDLEAGRLVLRGRARITSL